MTCETSLRVPGIRVIKPELSQLSGILFAVELAIGNEITRCWRLLKGCKQRLGSVLENLAIGGIAVPIFAHQRHPAVLRHHELSHRLFQVRSVVFRVAMGDRHGLLVTLGDVVASERETRRVEMVKTLINGFLLTHREG